LLVLFVILASIVVSTTISPYEQWLVGRVVALSDMALGSGVVLGWCCCCVAVQKRDPLPPCEQRLPAAA
jgi:hypothetical protein